MVLADSGDDSTDRDLDSESIDNEGELTDVTMPSTASSTSSGRTVVMRPRAPEEFFFLLNQCMFLPKQFFNTALFKLFALI